MTEAFQKETNGTMNHFEFIDSDLIINSQR